MKLARQAAGAARAWLNAAVLLAAALAALPVCAAEARVASGTLVAPAVAPAVGAGSAVPSLGLAGIVQALFGLVVVIGLVFACAWLARRFGLQQPKSSGLLKVVSSAALGQKERVVVVEIGETWLVLGVAPGSVRTLHTLPAGSMPAPASGMPFSASLAHTLRTRLGEAASRRGTDS
jgi:flagellar protein FliO/FliZ